MRSLEQLLAVVPGLYDDLTDAALPGCTGEPSDRSRDPRDKPTPGKLGVIEHRHLLLRGLRWWVDAVRDADVPLTPGVHNVRTLANTLLRHLDVMAPEDKAELAGDLDSWVRTAWRLADPVPMEKGEAWRLPVDAYDQRVRVADAAELLGCTVRTIQRRVPADRRPAGMVRLGDAAPRCDLCDLIVGQCAHTRA